MTILEALNSEVGNITLASKYLVLQGLNPDDTFTVENSSSVELTKAYCFRALVTQSDFSEDGLSITMNRPFMMYEANRIFLLNGFESEMFDLKPKIKDGTGRW